MSFCPAPQQKATTGQPGKSADPTLATARTSQTFTVSGFCQGADQTAAQRLHDLGFRQGTTVECLRRAPLGSPLMFRVCDTDICLRKQQAALITVS
ncbi:MAG: FeoA family protein [Rothia sp. (in: high G+C Gram-positive bacteria)]|nr:FeoA family protein [Rothia sp. (in: high G+C Gram-positive bacteria)]